MGEKRLSFTFESCLGTGGIGEVYVARMVRPGGAARRVAVKVLKQDLQNTPEAVQRLRDEGRMLAVLDHPCIVRVLEMTLIRGRVALVTEYQDGLDLARATKPNTRLPLRVVLGVVGEVASALHCAWTTPSPETGKPLQLIHRDIKPDNLRLSRQGEVKLLDFGIARTTEMYRHAKTAQGQLPFTPGYAPPEAFTRGFQGSPSDVFALGVTLYRLLVAERFYEGVDLAGQLQVCALPERYEAFLDQRLARLPSPEPVTQLVKDMLAYEPDARPTAHEVERRCRALEGEAEGPDRTRWARAMSFPPPREVEGASLTGQTIEEDQIVEVAQQRRRNNPREQHRRRQTRSELAEQLPIDEPSSPGDAPLSPIHVHDEPSGPLDDEPDTAEAARTTLDAYVGDGQAPPSVPEALQARSVTPAPVRQKVRPPTPVPPPPRPPEEASLAPMAALIVGLLVLLAGVGVALAAITAALFAFVV